MARLQAALAADALDHVVGSVAGRLVDQQAPAGRGPQRSRGADIARAAP